MKFVIVTGMSGAGKTTALKKLEDAGFYCVDNLPILLVEKFADLIFANPGDISNVALGIDCRSGEELSQLQAVLDNWKAKGVRYEILFLDASDERLIKRFKETRRNHPLAAGGRLDQGIRRERERLDFLKKDADYIIDTSQLLTRELHQELEKIFIENKGFDNLYITVLSFGFKYGIPADADLVFDVRFLPNPYYDEALRHRTGNEKDVQDFVMQGGMAEVFLDKLYDMLAFLLPNYVAEGRNRMVIAIGCTGGKHRSVTVANAIHERLGAAGQYGLKTEHRDIDNDSKKKK